MTICSKEKQKIFGMITEEESKVSLSPLGKLIQSTVERIGEAYSGVEVLNYVIMPNHVHMLLLIDAENPTSLFTVIRSLKTIVTKVRGASVWQDSYHEHIARSEREALRFWRYIEENPLRWTLDQYY